MILTHITPVTLLASSDWSFSDTLTVILFVIALAVAFGIFRRQRRTKCIEWMVWFADPLVHPEKKLTGLEVSINGHKLDDPRLVSMTIYNLSREPIKKDDWETPVTVSFPSASVATVETATNSTEFNADATIEGTNTVILRPLLMNYFDKVTLSILVDGDTAGMNLHCRIVGETAKPKHKYLRAPRRSLWDRLPHVMQLIVGIAFVVFGLLYTAAWVYHLIYGG